MTRKPYNRPPVGRYMTRGHRCVGCGARIAIGEPKATEDWPQRLNLSEFQVSQLLQAAAEYEELCEATGTISNAVECIDWLSVDALRAGFASPVTAEPPLLRTHEYRKRGAA